MSEKSVNSDLLSDSSNKRGKWSRQIEFFLSLLGYSVGIGSMIRFPYLCFNNGGGAFVIPFFLSYFICGIPLFTLELLLGQFSGLSPSSLWNFCPLLKGIGFSMACISGIVSLYYNMLIGYCLFYLIASFSPQVPWQTCGNWWNTEKCWDGSSDIVLTADNVTNATENFVWASDEYWHRRVLAISPGVETMGSIRWELALCSLAGWVITFACLAGGVRWTGKVVYVTAILPYICMVALVVRGCTLEGAYSGFLQMFYSLGPAWGGLITIASYNNFRHNCNTEARLIPFLDMATAVFAGFAVFSVLGSMATKSGLPIDKVAQTGPGLTFITYPLALGNLPGSQVWSVIFFLTVINLGLDSQFGMFETVLSGFFDNWPCLRQHHKKFVGVMALLYFCVGLIFCTEGGNYYYQLFDWYGATFTVPLVALLEIVAVNVVYGAENFSEDVRLMLGKPPLKIIKALWFVSMPLIFIVFLLGVISLAPPTYGAYKYPEFTHYVGIFGISLSTALPLPITAIYILIKTKPDDYPTTLPDRWVNRYWFNFVTRFRNSMIPSNEWKPQDPKYYEIYKEIVSQRKGGRTNLKQPESMPDTPFISS